MKCYYCGSDKIVKKVIMTSQYGALSPEFGPRHKVAGPLVTLSDHVFADICKNCGTINRMYTDVPPEDIQYMTADDFGAAY